MSSAENDRKFNSSWLKHWFKELTGTGGRCTWRCGCTQGLNLIINAYFLSISWFHFLPVSALISGSTWQANNCSRICSLRVKDNLFPEVTESLLCFLVLDWVTWPSPSHSQPLSSVQLSRSVVSDYLRPHGLQHTRLPCPSPTPGAYPNSCTLSRWYHPTISSSVIPFSSHLQSFPASGSFPMSQSLHQVAKVLEFQLQHQSFQWIFRTDFL